MTVLRMMLVFVLGWLVSAAVHATLREAVLIGLYGLAVGGIGYWHAKDET